jgi:hypothetical protein
MEKQLTFKGHALVLEAGMIKQITFVLAGDFSPDALEQMQAATLKVILLEGPRGVIPVPIRELVVNDPPSAPVIDPPSSEGREGP